MTDLPRRTIDDIKTRYFVEPTIRDVFVEGCFDKLVLHSWCEKHADKSFVAYEIDSIDIPFDILNKYDLTDGNKQRVIALAKELEVLQCDNYKCLVDKDLDHWFDSVENISQLIWTDFSSIEMYFFQSNLSNKF